VSSLIQEISSRFAIGDKSVDKTVYKNEEFGVKVLSLHSTPRKIHEELGLKTNYDKKNAISVYFKKLAHESLKVPAVSGIEPESILHYFKPYQHKRKKINFKKILEITSLKEITCPDFFEKRHDIFHTIKLVQEADILLTHSEYMAEELKSKLFADEKKIKIIPRGFVFKQPLEKTENYVLFCGRIAKYKNLELMIRAFHRAAPKGIQLRIAGDASCKHETEYLEHIKKVIHELPNDRVKLLGYVTYDKIWNLVSKAKLLIEPSFINDFPDSIIEAQSLGVPVIASGIAAHKNICAQTVTYFSVLSQNSLEEKIRHFYDDGKKVLDEETLKTGRINAQKYSWDKVSQEYRLLYKSL
jgi:glycosyltransferase involved in cell wall biosynthesis